MTAPAWYHVAFDRISRNHDVSPLKVHAVGADELAEEVWWYARSYCGSRDIDVIVDLGAMTGFVYAGVRVAGRFTIEELPR